MTSMCVTAVAIFNNGHHDIAAVFENRFSITVTMASWTITENRHCNNGQLGPILQRVACNDGNVIAAAVPVIAVLFCPLLQGPIPVVMVG
jgi:hypothetical protein